MKTLVVVSLLLVAGCLCSVEAQKCLPYSSPVTLSGKLTSRIFPGPPHYTSIRRGDQKETAILLILPAAICTTGNDPEGIDVPESGLRDIQIAVTKDGDWPTVRRLIGKRATVTGTLFHAHTGHHRTRVLLDLSRIIYLTDTLLVPAY